MEQEVLAEASLQDEVAHLVSDLDQVLRSDAPTSSYELFADHRPSSERLRDLLQLVLVEDVTAGETSQSSTVEERLALHRAECFEALLQTILKVSEDNQLCKSLTSFGDRLLDLGFEQVNEARRLVAAATTSSIARKLLYVFATRTDSLPVFTFDLARGGYASLEFPELNQPFPGIDGSQGYTLMFWMRVDRFDDACHTTLFGACDPSHTCFFLLYLDRKHHSLILQTSVSSSQPSVRFRDVSFVQHKLYHIALVHRKSEREAPGKALLYVDGVLREQARCSLPERPPPPIPTGKGSALEKHPAAQVQAFFGTPRDLSASSKPQTLYSKWSLASGHLINDTLVGDLVFMYYQLGPAYRGNFQDSLGSFLSYQASTNVNLRSEQRDKKNDVPSILPELTKSPGKLLNPEPVFVLSVSPAFARQMQSSQSEAQPILQSRILSGLAPADRLALNAAVPSSRKALTKQAGSGTFRGGVVLNNSLSLQDCCWRLAGSIPIALHFVANATTMEELVDATNFCFKLCKHDWRNSEAFERSSGFGVLSWLLQQKALPSGQGGAPHHASSTVSTLNAGQNIHSQSPSLLRAVLEASTVGNENEEALLVNPLAYRMLVTDNDLWQHTGSGTQDMLYNNLLALTSKSKHKDFNTRRLLQMRKRLMRHLADVR